MSGIIPLLARQPIFDRKIQVIAYELLCRNEQFTQSATFDGDAASSEVLLNAFTEVPIEQVVGKHQAFINFTRKLIESPPAFDADKLVIEVLEGQGVDGDLLTAIGLLKKQGYTIALDDFEITDETRPLIPYADIIKLDVLHLSPHALAEHVRVLKPSGAILLAEKIETYEMLEKCLSMGFDLFQGYFLAKPKIITGKKLKENHQSVLRLLSALHDPDVSVDTIELFIARDALLSFKLLRLVNSAAFGLSRNVSSLHQAIMLLGLNRLKGWVYLLTLSGLNGKPHELSITALTRARLCENIAVKAFPQSRLDSFFTVGLLSTLDAFLDAPLDEILSNLSLDSSINEAILSFAGPEGAALKIVYAYEQGRWEDIDWDYLQSLGIDEGDLAKIYVTSLDWVSNIMSDLADVNEDAGMLKR
jgi:EAL and modified HD-GYP domain-containing signal transduction protein